MTLKKLCNEFRNRRLSLVLCSVSVWHFQIFACMIQISTSIFTTTKKTKECKSWLWFKLRWFLCNLSFWAEKMMTMMYNSFVSPSYLHLKPIYAKLNFALKVENHLFLKSTFCNYPFCNHTGKDVTNSKKSSERIF